MKVYVVTSTVNELYGGLCCCVHGVFTKKGDALKEYKSMKKNWKDWSKGCNRDIEEQKDNNGTLQFTLINCDDDDGEHVLTLAPVEVQ